MCQFDEFFSRRCLRRFYFPIGPGVEPLGSHFSSGTGRMSKLAASSMRKQSILFKALVLQCYIDNFDNHTELIDLLMNMFVVIFGRCWLCPPKKHRGCGVSSLQVLLSPRLALWPPQARGARAAGAHSARALWWAWRWSRSSLVLDDFIVWCGK